jgi:hypothetical protein
MKNLTKAIGINQSLMKILIRMKLTFLFLLTGLIAVSASTYSQNTRLDVKLKDNSLIELFKEIEANSEFYFFYQKEELAELEDVTVNKKSAKVTEILDEVLDGTSLEYKIVDRYIIVRKDGLGLEDVESITSQQNSVSGKIADSNGESLPGVTVVIKGTTQGMVSDLDGNYTISNIPEDATLQFSFIGMKTQDVVVGDQTTIDVTMLVDAIGLEEVVAIGYGTARRKDISGAVSTVRLEGSPVSLSPNTNALQSLQGNVAGVNIGASNSPGETPDILVRGQNSINGDNNPLIVLDGIIYIVSLRKQLF